MDIFESFCVAKSIEEAKKRVLIILEKGYQPLYRKGIDNGGWIFQHHLEIKEESILDLFYSYKATEDSLKGVKDIEGQPVTQNNVLDMIGSLADKIDTLPNLGETPQPAEEKKDIFTPEQEKAFKEQKEKDDKNKLMKQIIDNKDLDLFHTNIKLFEVHEVNFINDKIK